jgi:hypothetical protein
MEYTVRSQIFDFLVTKNLDPETLDAKGQPTQDTQQADLISFDYKVDNRDYGTVVLAFLDENKLEIYYGDNLGRSMESQDRGQWYDMLAQLKQIAARNLVNFNIANLSRLKYTMKNMSTIKEGLFESFYGRKRTSYADQPNGARIVIQHDRDIAEGQPRHRAIDKIYIETAQGERFLVPSRSLMHAKMLGRHVSEGGTPYDAFGQHINQLVIEMNTLSKFIRATNGREYENEAQSLAEAARTHYRNLRSKAREMIGRRGYRLNFESFDPMRMDSHDVDLDRIREMFVDRQVDERIEQALPLLEKLKSTIMPEVSEFDSWTSQVIEGTWSLPDSSQRFDELKSLMADPLPVGPDALNATELLYDLVGDDELFDSLEDLAKVDPDADARPLILDRLGKLGYNIKSLSDRIQDTATEDLDVDGVMMTRASNMSS